MRANPAGDSWRRRPRKRIAEAGSGSEVSRAWTGSVRSVTPGEIGIVVAIVATTAIISRAILPVCFSARCSSFDGCLEFEDLLVDIIHIGDAARLAMAYGKPLGVVYV